LTKNDRVKWYQRKVNIFSKDDNKMRKKKEYLFLTQRRSYQEMNETEVVDFPLNGQGIGYP